MLTVWSQVVYTISFNAQKLLTPTTGRIYISYDSQKKSAVISLNCFNQLAFVMEMKYVSCERVTEFLYIIYIASGSRGLKSS
jgi:hypothetical protein